MNAEGAGPDVLKRLAPLRCGRDICGDLPAAERREWWIGNGRGAYAAGTIAQSLTRRYHGLLIASVDPPLGRTLVLTKADTELVIGDRRYPLFANRWASGAVAPQGHLAIESFALDGATPVWRFAIGDCRVEQRIWMEPGANTTYVGWRLLAAPPGPPPYLSVILLANGRDHHGETWMPGFVPGIVTDSDVLTMSVKDRFALRIAVPGGRIAARRDWVENFDLPLERERGLSDRDHHLCIGAAEMPLAVGVWTGLVASLDAASDDIAAALVRRQAHDRQIVERAVAADPIFASAPGWVLRLVLASDLYVIARPVPEVDDGRSVIAGYPWFGDWGRDTMISLPGLTLATGRYDDARKILETFARFVDRGMLPNVFPGAGGEPEYNTVDAALWYVEAWRACVAATDDKAALENVFPVLADIIGWHQRGTRYGIAVDPADGLLRAGERGQQLTWMDARVGDREITPRIGKPVEINALWHNALVAMAGFAALLGRPSEAYDAAAAQARNGFQRFLKPTGDGLFDVLDGPEGNDATLRPNQIFAVSLPASPLDAGTQRQVLEQCGRLLTSYGLRSLASDQSGYCGCYRGGVAERDGAYHQGPVWGWLLGHWAMAYYRVHGDAAAAQAWLEPVGDHLADVGLGQVSEIFDGDPPHTPRGAPAQAWSIACTLEAWWRLEHARRNAAPAGRGG
ncbi:MAG TPA: amylo-alpha-1,6-glucosidase [Stellaceae bacterium]|jgi:4-alpha-glucanotransferase|nr:amylo-alpha-1,6-glucosidase [Stellaceae bacterium]